jgi:hypothetical protein
MFICTGKLKRAMLAALPKWLALVVGFCILIPGQVDDAVAAVLVAVVLAVQPVRIPRFGAAWKGGKSHRRADQIGGR